MKKIISLLLIMTMAISLLACSQKSEETYTFQKDVENDVFTMTLYVKDDNIQRYTRNATKSCDNRTEEELEFLKSILENDKSTYEGLKGINYTFEVTDSSATVDQEVNIINKENLKVFLNNTEYDMAYDENTEIYSYEKEKEYLELAGYTLID